MISMSRTKSFCCTTLSIMLVCSYAATTRQTKPQKAHSGSSYTRINERDAITLALPVIRAILPGRGDLCINAVEDEMHMTVGPVRNVWKVTCLDAQGNALARVTRDADDGMIYEAGYDWQGAPVRTNPRFLSSLNAVSEARGWLRTLGFYLPWQLARADHRDGSPAIPAPRWILQFTRCGWCAHVALDEEAGSLMYVSIRPVVGSDDGGRANQRLHEPVVGKGW